MGGQEALRLPRRHGTPHLPFSPSRGLVRVLRPVVQSLVLPVLASRHHRALGCPVARQLVGHHDARCPALSLHQLAQQALGSLRIAPVLHQGVQHPSGPVDRAPQPVPHARKRQHDLVQVPLVVRRRTRAPDLIGECLAELQRPLPHGLVAAGHAGAQHVRSFLCSAWWIHLHRRRAAWPCCAPERALVPSTLAAWTSAVARRRS